MPTAEMHQEFVATMERIRASSGSLSEGRQVTGEIPPEVQAMLERVRNTADIVEVLAAKISTVLEGLTKEAPSFN